MAASLQSLLLLALGSGGAGTALCPNRACRRPNICSSPPSRRVGRGAVVRRRIRTLQKLVPGGESVGLDGLFAEAADYIACLRKQVEVMQAMVEVLSGGSDE